MRNGKAEMDHEREKQEQERVLKHLIYSQEENRSKHDKGLAMIMFGESLSEKYLTEKNRRRSCMGCLNFKVNSCHFFRIKRRSRDLKLS